MRGRSRMVRSARREGRGGAGRGEARTVADALGAEREGGDDGPDRLGETRAGAADEVARQPTRPRLGVRRDDDLVGGEHGERVLDGLQRIAVPDLARDTDSRRAEPRGEGLETPRGRGGGALGVRRPVAPTRAERGGDDDDIAADVLRAEPDRLVQDGPRERLVGDDEDAQSRQGAGPALVSHGVRAPRSGGGGGWAAGNTSAVRRR